MTNPNGPDLPVPEPDANMEYSSDSEHSHMAVLAGDDSYQLEEDDQPVNLTQAEFNPLTRDLNLSKESAQLLGSPFSDKHLLPSGTTFYLYRDRERELGQFFTFHVKSSLVYCNNIAGLIKSIDLEYDAMEWRFFIDSSDRSLKYFFIYLYWALFVSASYQTGLVTRSMTRRSIIVGIRGGKGRARAEARTLLDHADHRLT